MGGFNTERHLPNTSVQVTNYSDAHQYNVVLETIKVKNESIKMTTSSLNSGEGVFLDTGATVVVGSKDIVNGIFASLKSYCGEKPGERCGGFTHVSYEAKCFKVKEGSKFKTLKDLIMSFPPITFVF